MGPQRLEPARLAIDAPLGAPSDLPPEHRHHDKFAVKPHAHGRKQAGDERLEKYAAAQRHETAKKPGLTIFQHQQKTQELRQKQ